jgi:hypothetical protein
VSKRSLAKTAAERAVQRGVSKTSVAVTPLVALATELGVAAAVHGFTGPETLPWLTPGLALSTVGLTWLVKQVGRDRSAVGQLLSMGTMVLTGAHVIASAVMGPFSTPLIQLWGWGGATVTLGWIIRLWVAQAQGPASEDGTGGDWWSEAAERTGGSMVGSWFKAKEVTESQMKGPLQLEGGETVADVQSSRERLASVLGLPPGGVRITPDPDNASRGEMTLIRKDMLREPVPYVEPSALGASSALPVRVGRYEHGGDAMLWQHIPGWGEVSLLIMGMSGAGKTYGAYTLFGEDFTRTDICHVYVDVVKGAQSLGPIARGLKWVIRTEAEARALMTAIKDRAVPARAQWLGRRGLKTWTEGCGLPRLVVHVEEGAGIFLGSSDFIRSMERIRSVGIQIRLSMQRPSYTALDVGARSQFSAIWCFGVAEAEDARFAMPDDVLAAGADPSKWRNEQPGCSHLVGPGIPKDDHVVALRSLQTEDEQLELLAEYARRHGCDFHQVDVGAFGELFASRISVEDQLAGPVYIETDEVVDGLLIDETGAAGAAVEENEVPAEDRPRQWQPDAESDPDPDVQPDLDDEFEKAPSMRIAEPPVKLSPEDAAALFETRLVSLQAEGRDEVTAKDLAPVAQAAGRTPQWAYKLLARRVASGHLERTDTGWRFVRALTPA